MKFFKHESISMPGDRINEDIVCSTDTYGWVIDGATGLNNKNLTGTDSDAFWFVNEWNEYLKESITDSSRNIKEIVSSGIEFISNKFHQIIEQVHPDKIDLPSASIVIIRVNDNKMEYFLLGDCTLIIQNASGESLVHKQYLLEKLDGIAKAEVLKLIRDKGMKFSEAKQKISSLLIKHRLLKNTPEGYWTLEFEKEAVEKSLWGSVDLEECQKVLLMSDGFSAIFDSYSYTNKDNIISLIEEQGLQRACSIIRAIENEDSEILRFPRFKKSDDASAVFFIKYR